jgi:hypothetical protein
MWPIIEASTELDRKKPNLTLLEYHAFEVARHDVIPSTVAHDSTIVALIKKMRKKLHATTKNPEIKEAQSSKMLL